jgi:hypothetical protein
MNTIWYIKLNKLSIRSLLLLICTYYLTDASLDTTFLSFDIQHHDLVTTSIVKYKTQSSGQREIFSKMSALRYECVKH